MRTRKDPNKNNPAWNAHLSFSLDAAAATSTTGGNGGNGGGGGGRGRFLPQTLVVEVWDAEGDRFIGSTFFDLHWDQLQDGVVHHPDFVEERDTGGEGGEGGEGSVGGGAVGIFSAKGAAKGKVAVSVKVSLGMINKRRAAKRGGGAPGAAAAGGGGGGGGDGGRRNTRLVEWQKADIYDWAAVDGSVVEAFTVTVVKAAGEVDATLAVVLGEDNVRHTADVVVAEMLLGGDGAGGGGSGGGGEGGEGGEGGALQRAGVRVGDILQTVNGTDLSEMDLDDITRQFRKSEGEVRASCVCVGGACFGGGVCMCCV